MIQFSMLLAVLKFVMAGFDPAKIDYCNIHCGKLISTGCNCVDGKDRTYVTDNIQIFRQTILDLHNFIRNNVARGEQESAHFAPASNMRILRYDLELEYLARCYVMGPNFTHEQDSCNQASYCESTSTPGQNMAGSPQPKWNETMIPSSIAGWYTEQENIKEEKIKRELIDEFRQIRDFKYGQFTQLIWAVTDKIGCARAVIPKNPNKQYKSVLVCNYAGPPEYCAGNIVGKPVYLVGRPCRKCGDTKCNTDFGGQYDALCGKDVKAPDDPPVDLHRLHEMENKTSRNNVDTFFIVFMVICQIIVHNGIE